MTFMKSLALVAAFAVTAGAANAATCTIGNVSYTLTQGSPDMVTNSACFNGNDKNDIELTDTIFAVTGWTLGGATDGGGTGNASISLTGQMWSLGGTIYEHMMVALKQSNSYALFKVNTLEDLMGLWGTAGPGKSVNDLSHASVWYAGNPVDLSPVPLPAGAVLLLSALGGLALTRRGKKA